MLERITGLVNQAVAEVDATAKLTSADVLHLIGAIPKGYRLRYWSAHVFFQWWQLEYIPACCLHMQHSDQHAMLLVL